MMLLARASLGLSLHSTTDFTTPITTLTQTQTSPPHSHPLQVSASGLCMTWIWTGTNNSGYMLAEHITPGQAWSMQTTTLKSIPYLSSQLNWALKSHELENKMGLRSTPCSFCNGTTYSGHHWQGHWFPRTAPSCLTQSRTFKCKLGPRERLEQKQSGARHNKHLWLLVSTAYCQPLWNTSKYQVRL